MANFLTTLSSFWHYQIMNIDQHPITPGKIAGALCIFLVGVIISRFLSRWALSRLLKRIHIATGPSAAIQALGFYLLLSFFALFALHVVHVPLTVFTLLGGAAAIGVGFGSQNIMNNFISGLIILIERPIRPGDLITIEGQQGRVVHIGARCTRILLGSNIEILAPNSTFLEKSVTNWTHNDENIRGSLKVSVVYGSDPTTVRTVLTEIAAENQNILRSPAPSVFFSDFGDNGLVFTLSFSFRLTDTVFQGLIESQLRFEIVKRFNDAEIIFATAPRIAPSHT